MTWESASLSVYHHLKEWLAAIGFTGGGIGFIKYMKHRPAPYEDQEEWGGVWDMIQDVISNSRIGERRKRSGGIAPPVAKMNPIPEPQAANPGPKAVPDKTGEKEQV